jgi:endonuclease YncB( thermonuclease family)
VALQGVLACDSRERIGNEALQYVQENFLLRDAEFLISDVDRTGCFLGNITILGQKPLGLEADLLARGFTRIHKQSVISCAPRREMEAAELQAQSAKIGVWDPRNRTTVELIPGTVYSVRVTDLVTPVQLSVQLQSDELRAVATGLAGARQPAGSVLKGDLVVAVSDGKLYRARVIRVQDKKVLVEFLDLGLEDEVNLADLRVLPGDLASIPPQGLSVRLGGVRAFKIDQDFERAAMDYLWSLCEGAVLYLHLMYEDELPGVLLTDSPALDAGSLNLMLLTEGYVRVFWGELDPPFDALMTTFGETEDEARTARKGAWVHGNLDDDEDEAGFY